MGQMICFCAERFHWSRLWQSPGQLLLPGLTDMATRALLYRRPAETATLVVRHGSLLGQSRAHLPPPDLTDMPPRALLYRRPAEPATLVVRHGSQVFAIRL